MILCIRHLSIVSQSLQQNVIMSFDSNASRIWLKILRKCDCSASNDQTISVILSFSCELSWMFQSYSSRSKRFELEKEERSIVRKQSWTQCHKIYCFSSSTLVQYRFLHLDSCLFLWIRLIFTHIKFWIDQNTRARKNQNSLRKRNCSYISCCFARCLILQNDE
jgi:hypothetical protein